MRYKNVKTGIELNFSCEISGGDWVPVEEVENIPLDTTADVVDEEIIEEDAAEEPAAEPPANKKPRGKARK